MRIFVFIFRYAIPILCKKCIKTPTSIKHRTPLLVGNNFNITLLVQKYRGINLQELGIVG